MKSICIGLVIAIIPFALVWFWAIRDYAKEWPGLHDIDFKKVKK